MNTPSRFTFNRTLRGALIATVLTLGSATLVAQSSFAATMFARLSERQQALLNSLNLSPMQKLQATALQQKAQSARASALLAIHSTSTAVKRDLSNPQSNLHATVHMVQATVDQQLAQHRALTEERLRFYDSLSPEQQAIVRAQALARIEKLERLRDALLALSDDV
jgi:hypothetical protein